MTTFDPDTSPNPWRDTVRDIYDMLHLDDNLSVASLRSAVVTLIEDRHPRYFGAEPHPRRPQTFAAKEKP